MREQHACPKCSCTDLWVIDPVQQPNRESPNTSDPMPVTAPVIDGQRTVVGTFEAWICSACGYTEWYAKGLEDLAYLASEYDSGVRRVQGGAPSRGYR